MRASAIFMCNKQSQMRRSVKRQKRHRRRTLRRRGGGDYIFMNILEASPELIARLDAHMNQCWDDSTKVSDSLKFARRLSESEHNPTQIDIMYKENEEGNIVFSRTIYQYPSKKFLYISNTCVSLEERGKGHYKNSLTAMRSHYPAGVFERITNSAEYESAGGVDHSTRLLTFHKMGYRFQTEITDYDDVNPLYAKLKGTGEIVSIIRPVESTNRSTFKYIVKTASGEEKTIDIADIDLCQSQVYDPKTVTVKKGNSVHNREGIKFLGGEGVLTKNPESSEEEIIPWSEIEDVKFEKKAGSPFNPENVSTIYCPLYMNF